MEKKELEMLIDLIREHTKTQYLKYSEFDSFYDKVPKECLFSGTGYRLILDKKPEEVSPSELSNLYWSKSIEGTEAFLSLYKEEKKFTLVKAEIHGIDLNKFLDWLNKQIPDREPVNNHYKNEEEILCMNLSSFEIVKHNFN